MAPDYETARAKIQAHLDEQINAAAEGNNEEAHVAEDNAHLSALRAIAAGVERPAELAALALTSESVEHERWYA